MFSEVRISCTVILLPARRFLLVRPRTRNRAVFWSQKYNPLEDQFPRADTVVAFQPVVIENNGVTNSLLFYIHAAPGFT